MYGQPAPGGYVAVRRSFLVPSMSDAHVMTACLILTASGRVLTLDRRRDRPSKLPPDDAPSEQCGNGDKACSFYSMRRMAEFIDIVAHTC